MRTILTQGWAGGEGSWKKRAEAYWAELWEGQSGKSLGHLGEGGKHVGQRAGGPGCFRRMSRVPYTRLPMPLMGSFSTRGPGAG